MKNTCKVRECGNETHGKKSRCTEHGETCLAEYCETPSESVRCSKHAARYWRLGRSHLHCMHAGCTGVPTGDRAVCPDHAIGVSEIQRELDAAFKLLSEYGDVQFTRTR